MLTLYLGNLGSSKTGNAVRMMINDESGLKTYSNIKIKGKYPNIIYKNPKSIVKKVTYIENKKEKVKYEFNSELWLSLPKPCNICFDEITFVADSRKSQSQMSQCVTEFVYMARRIIGFDKYGFGDFIFIAQRMGTVDLRIRQLVTTIIWHILHWVFRCENCSWVAYWNTDKPNLKLCPVCNERKLVRSEIFTERLFFNNIEALDNYLIAGFRTYFQRDNVFDIAEMFGKYDTLQYIKYN